MNLAAKARDFLRAMDYSVDERARDFLIAEQPGLGGEPERLCLWVVGEEARRGRAIPALEEELIQRFRGTASKYPGARLYLLLHTTEGLSAEFRSGVRALGVTVQIPAWFFDLPFKREVARSASSAVDERTCRVRPPLTGAPGAQRRRNGRIGGAREVPHGTVRMAVLGPRRGLEPPRPTRRGARDA